MPITRPDTAALMLTAALVGCTASPAQEQRERPEPSASAAAQEQLATVVQPASLRGMEVELDSGERAVVPCATCHELREEPFELPTSADSLGAPHEGLKLEHGELACSSCHDPDAYDRLRLASGESIRLTEAMRLCAQCHGPQYRDYRAGAHGGMQGHWDLTRGPRTRRHCVDCHSPHAPDFPRVLPMPPPRDRFLQQPTETHHD